MTSPNIVSRDTPAETARLFKTGPRENLKRYQADWLDYNGSAYALIEDADLEAEVYRFLDEAKRRVAYDVTDDAGNVETKYRLEAFNPKEADVQQVVNLLMHECNVVSGSMSPPFFTGYDVAYDGLDPKNLISCQNGLLDITDRTLYDATPLFFTRTALPAAYDPEAKCPMFETFLFQVLADKELVRLMGQWFGYLITSDFSIQKVLYLQGVPRSGKGTIGRVLDELIGDSNVTSHTLADVALGFGRESLIGKSLLKIGDMNSDLDKKSLAQAVSIINGISGQDRLHIERKHKGAVDIKPQIHIALIGNLFPDFGIHAAALGKRLIVFPFRKSIPEDEQDTGLDAKLLSELPGILNFALAGLADLRASGNKFMTCAASEDAKRQILNSGNPVRAFVNDGCDLDPAFEMTKDDLFEAYTGYCINTRAHPLARTKFFTDLKTAFPELQETRPWGDGVDRPRVIEGVRLRDFGPPTTATRVYWLDADIIELGIYPPDDDRALMRDPITGSPIEAIEDEFEA